jgi:hypothetical protein
MLAASSAGGLEAGEIEAWRRRYGLEGPKGLAEHDDEPGVRQTGKSGTLAGRAAGAGAGAAQATRAESGAEPRVCDAEDCGHAEGRGRPGDHLAASAETGPELRAGAVPARDGQLAMSFADRRWRQLGLAEVEQRLAGHRRVRHPVLITRPRRSKALGLRPAAVAPLVRVVAAEQGTGDREPAEVGFWMNPGWSRHLTVDDHPDWADPGGALDRSDGLVTVVAVRERGGTTVSGCATWWMFAASG